MPNSFRKHIGIFGKRNVGKSSLLNSLSNQNVSIVSKEPGTTSDPVKKAIEIPLLGPALLIDTAGMDDIGSLGKERNRRSQRTLDRTDIGIVVSEGSDFGNLEEQLLSELEHRNISSIVVFNKIDLSQPSEELVDSLTRRGIAIAMTNACTGSGMDLLRQKLAAVDLPEPTDKRALVADLVGPLGIAILVVPIDSEAPKGRLILPQAQAIRELLDHHACCLVTQVEELPLLLSRLNEPPELVVTDSQAFEKVTESVPLEVPVTSFSILFSRFKGDLYQQVQGVLSIRLLRPGDRILIAEACSHHPTAEDIGRVQIPCMISNHLGGEVFCDVIQGHDLPLNLSDYHLIVHCGACMWTRREMQTRLLRCKQEGIPITNYGLVIAYVLGILGRALKPFPDIHKAYHRFDVS